MELSVNISNTQLSLRVIILLKTPNGFVFEPIVNRKGSFVPVNGLVMLNETSFEASTRIIKERFGINLSNNDFENIATLENFFSLDEKTFQEINIVNYAKVAINIAVPDTYKVLNSETVSEENIQPAPIKTMIISNNFDTRHYIVDYGN